MDKHIVYLANCFREIEQLHAVTYERNYINNVNSCIFVLVGIWRDEKLHLSCRNRKRSDGTVVVLSSFVHIAALANSTFYNQQSLQNTIFDKSLQSLPIAQSAYCWVAYL